MNLIIIFVIAIITTMLIFATCGAGGGLMMLVALNGFSESEATPMLIVFALVVLGISFAVSTAAGWIFIKSRRDETAIGFWHVAGISAAVNILAILLIVVVIAVRNFL
jgi:hypothetical protein